MEHNPERVVQMHWNVSAFLPVKDDTKVITEALYPQYFGNDYGEEAFWSVLERAVDIRWITSKAGMLDNEEEPATFRMYQSLELGLFHIVSQFGRWSVALDKVTTTLSRSIHDKIDFVDYWDAYRSNILEVQKGDVDELTVVDLMRDAIEAFVHINFKGKDSQYKYLKSIAEEFIRNHDASKAIQFAGNVQGFLAKQLQIKITGKHWDTIKQIYSMQQKIVPDRLSANLVNQLHDAVQQSVDTCCMQLNSVNGQQRSDYWARDIQNKIDEVMLNLGLASDTLDREKRLFDEYAINGKRCVALCTDTANLIGMLAFSGYFDCQDQEVIEVLGLNERNNREITRNMEEVCRCLDVGNREVSLVKLNTGCVDYIERYEVGEDLQFLPSGPMRREIKEIKDYLAANTGIKSEKELSDIAKRHYGLLKKEYACCERKILAIDTPVLLAYEGYDVSNLTLYVKFRPCIRCYGAITAFNGHGTNMTVRYPNPLEM